MSFGNAPLRQSDSESEDSSSSWAAKSADLSEEGYRKTLAAEDPNALKKFVKLAAEREGLRIISEPHLDGMLPFYDGSCDTQSYEKLVRELHRGAEMPDVCGG